MAKKLMLVVASALAAIAFAVLPALATAAPSIHFSVANPTFTGTFGEASLTAVGQEQIVCTGENHVSGSWETEVVNGRNTGKTGHLQLTLTNCHTAGGVTCTTSGQAAGTITVASAEFHLVYITSDVAEPTKMLSETLGILITPPAGGTFAQFSCTFFANLKVTGNGIVGHVSKPACGTKTGTSTIRFSSSSTGVQTYKLAEGDATTYHLNSSLNGGAAVEASEDIPSLTTTLTSAFAERTCGTPPAVRPSIHFSDPNPTFTGTFGEASLTAAGVENLSCFGENHVTGVWLTEAESGTNTGSIGDLALTFTNCRAGGKEGTPCTTSGQASGTITVNSEFELVYITSDIAEPTKMFTKTVGILIIPPAGGTIAKFSCGEFATFEITGNGIIGHLSKPGCTETADTSTMSFTSNSTGVQTYQLAEGDGTTYHLKLSLNGGTPVEASEDLPSVTMTLGAGARGELTCP